ncbi:MAG: hypothetical protein K6B14_11490 [Lachnospiraceae bacterium]|nr:hypothetical protein [Lachnospiraceae bacterium]
MKKSTVKRIFAVALFVAMVFSLAACGKGKKADVAADGDGEYVSADGWSVSYDQKLFTVNENDEHTTSFVYQGDSAGTNMVTISYVAGKMPEEAMSEITESWEDQERTEGFFPGTDDKWGYWRELKSSDEGSGYGETVIGGEYNGGALIFDVVSHKGKNDEQNMAVSDYLSMIIDSIKYEDFGPQTMFAYYPGTYNSIDADTGATYSVVLNEDHYGKFSFQDDVKIIWGGYEITDIDNNYKYEYTIEGDNLMLNYDGMWLTFSKGDKPAVSEAVEAPGALDAAADATADAFSDDGSEADAPYDPELMDAINYYITNELGKMYEQSDVTIPNIILIDVDDSDENDVKAYGDFWVMIYKINGDTLETQAGGSYPGCVHLKKLATGYSVTSMDVCEDGSSFDESAKRIFGDRYNAFMQMHSDDVSREKLRADQIAAYVKSKGILVTQYQDYGWDPKPLQ